MLMKLGKDKRDKLLSSSRSRNSNSCKEPAYDPHSPTKSLVAAEEWGSNVGPDAWMGDMAPMLHRGQGMPWGSPDELLGLCQRPWAST